MAMELLDAENVKGRKAIWLFDRGFPSIALMQKLERMGARFVMRASADFLTEVSDFARSGAADKLPHVEWDEKRQKGNKIKTVGGAGVGTGKSGGKLLRLPGPMDRRQKERRTKEYQKEKAFVKNTVIEVQTPAKSVVLAAVGMKTAFLTLLAYLLSNGLLSGKTLVFFTDGAKGMRGHIVKLVAFRKFRVILDWRHLMERCKVCLSGPFKGGKEQRNQILLELSPLLWTGDVSAAVAYLKGLNPEILRPKNRIEELQNQCH